MDAQHFKTQEAILAFCLDIAGCEFLDTNQPCVNLYDEEILSKLSYRGKKVWDAAQEAWRDVKKGHVEYVLKMTPRLLDLIKAYRDQCAELERAGGNATTIFLGLMGSWKAGAIMDDEAMLRIACVNLKTRGDFMNIWKKMVPVLRVPVVGKTRTMPGAKTGEQIVSKPGYIIVSLNASEATRKGAGL